MREFPPTLRRLNAALALGALFFSLSAPAARAVESLIVTTTADEDNGTSDPGIGAGTSLREAINRANTDNIESVITFNASAFAAPRKIITLGGTQLPNLIANFQLTILAPVAGVEIHGNNASRIFQVNVGASATLAGLTIRFGNAGLGGNGGGILNLGNLALADCTVTSNSAVAGGGISSDNDLSNSLTLINCSLGANVASQRGGAINNSGGSITIDSCTIAGNTAPANFGAGVASFGSVGASTAVRNSIISSNTGTDVDFVSGVINSFQSNGYNLIGDGNGTGAFNHTGDVINNTNPGLAPFADRGGPTQTRALLPGSPAIDTGDTNATTDQRGTPRPQGFGIDKGAFESSPTDPGGAAIVVTTTQDTVVFDGVTSLREAIQAANVNSNADLIAFNIPAAQQVGGVWTINLASELPALAQSVTITGPGARLLTVRRNTGGQYRIFTIAVGGLNIAISGMTIRDGQVTNNPGGGIASVSPLTLSDCLITNNQILGSNGGGGVFLRDSSGSFTNCTFSNNTSGNQGGGIEYDGNAGGTLTLRNCTVSGNTANGGGAGGGILNLSVLGGSTTLEVINCTIANNTSAMANGGGIRTEGIGNGASATTILNNTIVANNTTPNLRVAFSSGATATATSQGYNLCSDNGSGFLTGTGDKINTNPQLGPLQDNGGQTPTHALLFNSPAREAGNTTLTVDQRGVSRPQPAGGADDIGAYELNVFAESLLVTTTTDEDNGTSDPIFGTGTSLREAINRANGDGVNSVITFSPTVFAAPRKIITLNGTSLPSLSNNGTLNINPPTAGLELSGNNQSRLFSVGNGANVTLTGLTLRNGLNNQSGVGGGAILVLGTLLLDSCTLSNNSATQGGAISLLPVVGGATLTMRNCTLSGNTATVQGGAVSNFDGTAILDSSTLAGNTAPTNFGSGIASVDANFTHTQVRNSLIAGNTNTDVDLVGTGGVNSFQSNGYNLIGDGHATGEFVEIGDQVIGNGSPGLAALAENGGRTQTRALQAGSLARDKGNTDLTVDQRGVTRPLDYNTIANATNGDGSDIGAFEFNTFTEPLSLVVTTSADENDGTSDPNVGLGTSLREAINRANTDGVNSAISFSPTVFAAPRKTITLGGTALSNIVSNGTLSITAPAAGVEISGNNASRIFAILNGANVTLTGVTIRNGFDANSGGGISNLGALLLDRCTLFANTADEGGAIRSNTDLSVTLTLRNCTLSGNTATERGGAIYNFDGQTIIESSTISGNIAPPNFGAGIASFGDNSTITQAHNSIIAGNRGAINTDVDFVEGSTNSFQSNGYNLIGSGNATGDFNQPGDTEIGFVPPRLGPLQNNGGPTFTRAVLLTSFARNTGDSSLTIDQRGLARLFGTAADKGAYELQYETYAWWAGYTFPAGTPPALLAPEGDYDGDGIPNGIERATGRDPLTANAFADLLLFEIQDNFLVLQFERAFTVDPAAISAEQSLDLQMWTTNGITFENLGPVNGYAELIQALIPINGEPKKFGRLRHNP